jgi:3-isopropylmalate/(R)-2-methylmalate dehydratase large subunit
MSGQTIVEKILSKHAGRDARAGETVIAKIDVAMATDGSGPLTLEFFKKMGGQRVFDPNKVLMVLDHYVPCPNDKVAALQDSMREFRDLGLCQLMELGEGICHQLLPEKGYVLPGGLIIGGDSHSTTYGAFNALGTGVGSSDLAAAMISGKLWFRVPETIRINLA